MNRSLGLLCLVALAGCASNDDEGDDPEDTDAAEDTDTTDTDTTDTDTPGDTDTPPAHTPLWYTDDDGDGYSEEDGDCDDDDELQSPGLPEICENGVDDDCDTVVDDLAAGSSTLGPFEYLEAADSPWDTIGLSTFVLEDFEDQALPAGVTVTAFTWSSSFSLAVVDSVDGDDGDPTDGVCNPCEAMWHSSAITFTFDPAVLGALPTHAGVVVTDAFSSDVNVNLSATSACASLGALTTGITFGDGSIGGETAEDRFVGFESPAGMTSLTIDVGGAFEVDHLQFGW